MSNSPKSAGAADKDAPAEKEYLSINVLAFLLSTLPRQDDENEITMASVMTHRASVWRTDREQRAAWRKLAREFTETLGEYGLRVKVASSPKLEKGLQDICTIPAKQAYDPAEEV